MSPEPGNLRLETRSDTETWDKLDQARITQRVLLPGFDRLGAGRSGTTTQPLRATGGEGRRIRDIMVVIHLDHWSQMGESFRV